MGFMQPRLFAALIAKWYLIINIFNCCLIGSHTSARMFCKTRRGFANAIPIVAKKTELFYKLCCVTTFPSSF